MTTQERDYLIDPERIALETKTVRDIQMEIVAKYALTLTDLLSDRRERRVAWPRQEAFWRCRQETTKSFPTIARAFRRDSSTVQHGARAYEQRMRAG